jgi:hypothetical protein
MRSPVASRCQLEEASTAQAVFPHQAADPASKENASPPGAVVQSDDGTLEKPLTRQFGIPALC